MCSVLAIFFQINGEYLRMMLSGDVFQLISAFFGIIFYLSTPVGELISSKS
uniref:Uncharacterized protein n=1 Tax=Nelumbo nucifera TaxID=4432 RepID=A0A822ZFJ9_NELNU|nr:TPA_asm: hypothetical protein HUJ06_016119 [Nelumbo nucifera]